MEERLPVFAAELLVCIAQHETDSGEEIGFAGAIATDDDVVFGAEGLDDRLVFVGLEALDDDLFDVHVAMLWEEEW